MSGPGQGPDAACDRLVLVHGLWNSPWWLLPLARRLRGRGFQVETFGYPSIVGGAGSAVEALVERLRGAGPCHLVGHSLGGLVAVEALRQAPALPVRRVVCIGSPLCGSATARFLAARRSLAWALGRSAPMLLCGCQPWRGRQELGVIAGNVPRGVGRLLAAVGLESDGTVGVEETRLPGATAHCRVPASHTGLVLSAEAARQAASFLRNGRFADADGGRESGGRL